MSLSLTIYLHLLPNDLEIIVESFKKEFDDLLNDSFSESELVAFESKIDSLGAVYVQPVSEELSFEDFYPNPDEEEKQKAFFVEARSSLCIENLPFFESNSFQVTYLKLLLGKFSNFLVDRGGVHELMFKESYLEELQKFKNMDAFLITVPEEKESTTQKKNFYPVDPLDFIFVDVIKEMERVRSIGEIDTSSLGESPRKIFEALLREDFDHPIELFKASGLGPKSFDDGLERLKFFLRSL